MKIRTGMALLAAGMLAFQGVALAGTLSGKVTFEGDPPAVKPINFGGEKQCAEMHGDKPPVDESLVLNPDKTVKWALVYVKEGVTGEFPAPAEPAAVDQVGCVFVPHVKAVRAGQKIVFKNSDPVLHNVRAVAKANKSFNIAQPVQNMRTTKTLANPEIGVQMRCDVHFWMVAYVHAIGHPFYAVTGDDGSYSIVDLPAGTYTIELWHETLGTQTQTVTVGDGGQTLDFTISKKA